MDQKVSQNRRKQKVSEGAKQGMRNKWINLQYQLQDNDHHHYHDHHQVAYYFLNDADADADADADDQVPRTVDALQGVLTVIPLQLLSYHLAVLRSSSSLSSSSPSS